MKRTRIFPRMTQMMLRLKSIRYAIGFPKTLGSLNLGKTLIVVPA